MQRAVADAPRAGMPWPPVALLTRLVPVWVGLTLAGSTAVTLQLSNKYLHTTNKATVTYTHAAALTYY